MDIKEALKEAVAEAIDSLGTDMCESYEGDELEDPEVASWIAKKEDAIEVLTTWLDMQNGIAREDEEA